MCYSEMLFIFKPNTRKVDRPKGFSLIELLIVMILISILVGVAVPSLRALSQNRQLTTQKDNFLTTIQLTRSEAIKRGIRVGLCPVASPGASTNVLACASSTNWATGWMAFVDDNGNDLRDIGGCPNPICEEIVRVWSALPSASSLTGPATAISFLDTGRKTGTSASFSLLSADCSGKNKPTIAVTIQGYPSVSLEDC